MNGHIILCKDLSPRFSKNVVLLQPDNLEAAENFAKLKESVLSSSEKATAVDAKQVSAQIFDELSKAKDKQIEQPRAVNMVLMLIKQILSK